MSTRSYYRWILLSTLLLGATGACAHDGPPSPGASGVDVNAGKDADATGESASGETGPVDYLEEALRAPSPSEVEPELEQAVSAPSTHPGKLERIERRMRQARSKATKERGGENGATVKADGLLRIQSESYGTPGLVLVRAMEGAQTLGYTILTLDERDMYFIALKKASFLQTFIGSQRGACKIAVGTQKSAEGEFTRVTLKARPQTSTLEKQCSKDLEKILRYARGEISDKHKKRRRRVSPKWRRSDAP